MSYWGTTVFANFFSVIPYIGSDLYQFILGGSVPCDATLKRFYAIHFFLGIFSFLFIIIHIFCVHISSTSGNQCMISEEINRDYKPLYPDYVLKDIIGFIPVFIVFIYFVTVYPDYFGHPENYEQANSMVTPKHITPE